MASRATFDDALLDMPEVTGHAASAARRAPAQEAHAEPARAPSRSAWGGEDVSGQWWVVSRSRQGF